MVPSAKKCHLSVEDKQHAVFNVTHSRGICQQESSSISVSGQWTCDTCGSGSWLHMGCSYSSDLFCVMLLLWFILLWVGFCWCLSSPGSVYWCGPADTGQDLQRGALVQTQTVSHQQTPGAWPGDDHHVSGRYQHTAIIVNYSFTASL